MWIARDKNGFLWTYKNKPIKKSRWGLWVDIEDDDYSPICLWTDAFLEVRWEDEEPRELILQ